MKKGSEGAAVKALQQKLIALGYSCGSAGADGDFGTGTEAAVLDFQSDNNLDADGVVGPKTWAAFKTAKKKSEIPSTTGSFKPRLTRPTAGNKYYITKAKGGYSNAIQGSPTDSQCDVLANCVGYAYGRFNEIGGYGSCKYLYPTNAENFMDYTSGLKTGMTP